MPRLQGTPIDYSVPVCSRSVSRTLSSQALTISKGTLSLWHLGADRTNHFSQSAGYTLPLAFAGSCSTPGPREPLKIFLPSCFHTHHSIHWGVSTQLQDFSLNFMRFPLVLCLSEQQCNHVVNQPFLLALYVLQMC